MIFGGTARERIQFNEETLWSGGPYDPVVEGAHEGLPEIRRMLFDGEYDKAHDLFGTHYDGCAVRADEVPTHGRPVA